MAQMTGVGKAARVAGPLVFCALLRDFDAITRTNKQGRCRQ